MPGGTETTYTKELADEICAEIANQARGLKWVLGEDDRFPCARTFHRWLEENEELRQTYLRARQMQAELLVDETMEIADECNRDIILIKGSDGKEREAMNGEFIQRSKIRIDMRFRLAGKLHPKKWGEKQEIEHSGGLKVVAVTPEDEQL